MNDYHKLERNILLASQLYYQDGSSPYSDEQFDCMVSELKRIHPDSKLLQEPSFGYSIQKDTTPGERCLHWYSKVSTLEKAYNYQEVHNSLKNNIWCSPKLDGMSVALYYKDGKLVQALTRGDYTHGIDITDKVLSIVSPYIHDNITGGIRGEIIMSKDNYQKYKELHPDAKNARNVVAGIINSKNLSSDISYLDVVVYTILGIKDIDFDISMSDMIQILNRNFTKVVPYSYDNGLLPDTYFNTMEDMKLDWDSNLSYQIDGIVITHSISVENHSNLIYDSQAIKFKSEQAVSEVEDIEWTMSKTHYAIPRIKIKPVELDGSTVTYVTGYNAKYISDMKICKGAVIKISKHGDIIPNIDEVVSYPELLQSYFALPSRCNECGELLSWEGVHLKCTNPDCMNAILQDLLIWIDNLAPIDDFGDKLRLKFLRKTYKDGDISIERIMEDSEGITRSNHLLVFGTGQSKLYGKMLKELYTSRLSITSALMSLNVPRLGKVTCSKLSEYPEVVQALIAISNSITSLEDLKDVNNFESLNNLQAIVGAATSKSILQNLNKFRRLNYICNRIDWNTKSKDSRIKVAITGKLSIPRKQFESELESNGYQVSSLTRNTKFLITDNPNSNSSKNKQADKYGIQKLSESEFRTKYMNH